MPVKPALVAFVALLRVSAAQAAEEGCPGPAAETALVRLLGVDEAGDPVLEDGRRLRLIGIAARQDDAEASRFSGGIGAWRGKTFSLVVLAGPDRWGRLPARLLATPEEAPSDLAVILLRAKAAARMPEPEHRSCDALLRAALGETPALVTAARPAVTESPVVAGAVDGHDVAALKGQAGRIVALQGRVASVGERAQRTYLNFSRRRGEAASIVMSKKLWREMTEKGWTAATLPGKRVLARGVLSGQDGLLLEIGAGAALDVID